MTKDPIAAAWLTVQEIAVIRGKLSRAAQAEGDPEQIEDLALTDEALSRATEAIENALARVAARRRRRREAQQQPEDMQ